MFELVLQSFVEHHLRTMNKLSGKSMANSVPVKNLLKNSLVQYITIANLQGKWCVDYVWERIPVCALNALQDVYTCH